MLRRLGPRRDGGAGFAEYAGLVVLAALILGALYAGLKTTNFQGKVSAAVCQIMGGENCGKPQAGGQDNGGDDQSTAAPSPGRTGGDQGKEPSLADLQKQADDAQKAADGADGKYGNIKQQIIDLLKDFIGITDVEDCITKGSISACLWAAFDVGSLFFAALKIGKFAKAVKNAVKLWKDFNKGRKIIDRAKDAAKRAKALLKKKRISCGLPAGFQYPNAPPGRVVHASFADLTSRHGAIRTIRLRFGPSSCPRTGGFKVGMDSNEITDLNKKFDAGRVINGTPEDALINAERYSNFWDKSASLIRNIAHDHMFANGNKRTATAVVEELMKRNKVTSGPTSADLQHVVNEVAKGKISSIEDISAALRGY